MPGPIQLQNDEEGQGRVGEFLDDSREFLQDGVEVVGKGAAKLWHGFSSFAIQDNVLEVAVGLMSVVYIYTPTYLHAMLVTETTIESPQHSPP
jgi:hypothetical protein